MTISTLLPDREDVGIVNDDHTAERVLHEVERLRQELAMERTQHAVTTAQLHHELEQERRLARERAELLVRERAARRLTEEACRIKDEFLATVSHELRTPLLVIGGWATMLRNGVADDPARLLKGLEVIDRNVRSQTRILEDILDISGVVTGRMRMEPEPVNFQAVAREAFEAVRPSMAAKGIEMQFLASDARCLLVGDPVRLRQIVWNLLSNAIKFTPEGGIVTLSLRHEEKQVVLTVQDTGKGIDPAFLPYVFDRFGQTNGSTTQRYGGLGLGLAIVKHLVELHGGQVEARSDGLATGATFVMRFPAAATDVRWSEDLRRLSLSQEPASNREQKPLEGVRVLLVEDDDDGRDVLQEILMADGATVEAVDSAAAGIASLDVFRPHVLVSDLGLPDQDGWSFLREVRSLPTELRKVPAIAVSAYVGHAAEERAIAAGFQRYITKPLDPQRLTATVVSVLLSPAAQQA